MHLPKVHVEDSIPVLRQLILDNPLGVLTTAIPNAAHPTILSSHIPWVLDVADHDSKTELGILRGHLARANPQTRSIIQHLESKGSSSGSVLEEEVLVLFTVQAHHYVTAKFYVDTKPASGKVVPTWNYAAAQAYGRARIWYDSKALETRDFLSRQIRALSRHAEESLMGYDGRDGRPKAWAVEDAPDKYIDMMQKGIIGIEIEIDRLEGKFKMNQESPLGDREGVVAGFEALGSDVGTEMAEMVKKRGDLKDAAKSSLN